MNQTKCGTENPNAQVTKNGTFSQLLKEVHRLVNNNMKSMEKEMQVLL